MASEATPRVSSAYLGNFTNQTVRVLGKVTALHSDTCTVDAQGSVTVHLNRDAQLHQDSFADVVGKVQPDLSVKAFHTTDFGSNIDVKANEAVIEATHRYKEIFYKGEDD